MRIPEPFIQSIIFHAENDYPKECCGFLLGSSDKNSLICEIVPCRNIQDDLHGQDPIAYPRSAKDGYFASPEDLLKVEKRARSEGKKIRGIYHSHIDAGAYFSEEDKRLAVIDGIPAYPDVFYAVVSVSSGKAEGIKVFTWNSTKADFVESASAKLPLKGSIAIE